MAGILGDDASGDDTPLPQAQTQQAPPAPPQAPASGGMNLPHLGIFQNMQAQYAPGAYKARVGAYQQQLALQAQQAAYEGITAKMGPGHEAEARMLSLNPNLATEMMKPQVVGPGAGLYSGLGGGGGGGGGSAAGGGAAGNQPLAQNQNGMYSPETARREAENLLIGDDSGLQTLGKGPEANIARAQIQNLATKLAAERNITPAMIADRTAKFPAYKSAVNDLTKSASEKGVGASEFNALAPHLQQTVGATASQFPSYNAFKQYLAKNAGSPQATAIQQQITGLMNAYSRATGNKDDAHVEDVLNKTWSGGQIGAGIQALQQEIQATQAAIPKQMNRLKVQHGLADKASAGTFANAKAAIAQGRPRDQVIQKIEEAGYSAEGL